MAAWLVQRRKRLCGTFRFGIVGLVGAALGLGAVSASAEVSLPAVFGDHMVLQRETEAPVWGLAGPGERVAVTAEWLDEEVATVADGQGQWRVRVRTPAAGGPYTVTVRGTNTVTLSDVLIGEVWICSGQSNMEWPMTLTMNSETEIAAADWPKIRVFNVERALAVSPQTDCAGQWAACSPETVAEFSAVGYFFGRELHRELDVPIGLIGSNWGGTVAEAWTSTEALQSHGGFDEGLALLADERKEPGSLERNGQRMVDAFWKGLASHDAGTRERWMAPEADDSAWQTMQVPAAWETAALPDFDGVAWFRATVELPADWSERELTLELGPIDDVDTTWFNGVKVGGLEHPGRWYTPREYTVPASAVRSGQNVIAIRVLDNGGLGGLVGRAEQLRLYPAGDAAGAVSLAGPWRYMASTPLDKLPPWPRVLGVHQNMPSVLYNGMIAPVIPYALRGTIWYQGESNRLRGGQYRTLFPALIGDWRQRWGRGPFPFYYVQIAPFRYAGDTGQAGELREAQRLTLAVQNTGMVVTSDIGNPKDIHPRNKQEVGRRLALWALAGTYGQTGVVHSGPLYRSMKVEGDRIRIQFDHAGGGLASRDGKPLSHFEIAGEEGKFVSAAAIIEGATVVVHSDKVPQPRTVRFGWSDTAEPNLMNKEGLPASPFRTGGNPDNR